MGTMAGRDEINMRAVIVLIMTMVILIGCGSWSYPHRTGHSCKLVKDCTYSLGDIIFNEL